MAIHKTVDDVIAEYMVDCDEGRSPNVDAIIDAHPEFADELNEFFADEKRLDHYFPITTNGRFGEFSIQRELGRGGWGTVYEAKRPGADGSFALKVLATNRPMDQSQLIRFRNEAELLQQLSHPNIVEVLDFGEVNRTPYYTMPLMRGHVGELIANHRDQESDGLDSKNVADLIRQVADGLAHAHRSGIVHRDVKPSNILLGEDQVPRIADFGLARWEGSETLTISGDIVGTLRYASPETILGERAAVDQRSDVYSLGATMWEMLTLRPLVADEGRLGIVHGVLHQEAPLVSKHNKAVPYDLETIVMKCLNKAPAERYPSATALAEDLARFSNSEPIVATRPSFAERSLQWVIGNQRSAAAIMACIGLVLMASLLSSLFILRAQRKTKAAYAIAVENEQKSRKLQKQAEASERKAKRLLYATEMGQANEAWLAGNLTQTRIHLEEIERFDPDYEFRHLEWDFLWNQCSRDAELLIEVSDKIFCLEALPGGAQFVTAGPDSVLRFHDFETGEIELEFSTDQSEINRIAFSPNKSQFATAGDDGTVKVWDAKTRDLVCSTEASGHVVWSTAFLSDEQLVATSGDQGWSKGHFEVFSAKTGKQLGDYRCQGCKSKRCREAGVFLVLNNGSILSCRDAAHYWNPVDGKFKMGNVLSNFRIHSAAIDESRNLAFFGGHYQLIVCDLETLNPIQRIPQQNRVYDIELFPKRGMVAIGVRGGQVRVYRIEANQEGPKTLTELNSWTVSGEPETLLRSVDEEHLLFSVDHKLYRTSLESRKPTSTIRKGIFAGNPRSQQYVAYSDGQIFHPQLTNSTSLRWCTISGDGAFVAGITNEVENDTRRVLVWDVEQDKLVFEKTVSAVNTEVRFSGDGRYIAVSQHYSPDGRIGVFSVLDWRADEFTFVDRESGTSRWDGGFDPNQRVVYRPRDTLLCRDSSGNTLWRDDEVRVKRLALHPTKNLVAVANSSHQIEIRDTNNGEILQRFPIPSTTQGICFTSDGERLCHVTSHDVYVLDSENGRVLLTIPDGTTTDPGSLPIFIENDRVLVFRRGKYDDSTFVDFRL